MKQLIHVIAAVALLATPVAADDFRISPEHGEGSVVFESKAPMESFEGKTNQATGEVSLDPASITELSLRVEVDMASLDTGIGLRHQPVGLLKN